MGLDLRQLLSKASRVRAQGLFPNSLPPAEDLFFPSCYYACASQKTTDKSSFYWRGFSNWIIPGRIMVGQYPGQVPEMSGPTSEEVETHLTAVLEAATAATHVCFVSLQSELPAQGELEAWNRQGGQIYLDAANRKDFPRPFVHYKPIVDTLVQKEQRQASTVTSVSYEHWPIQDLSIPSSGSDTSSGIYPLMDALLSRLLEDDSSCLYIHCWGGRGRAGLTAACLLTLLYPEVLMEQENTTHHSLFLNHIQQGYDTRLGAEQMSWGLRSSPQTEVQRQFVRDFGDRVRRLHCRNRR